ncbi:pyridoxamine 5'-phosphate oxidase family protein [Undibacterium sp.]|jgi:predicted pyridoxine 5'-phosphate oxidase superfamily flavin-nucleotide-binding protein|uniref:pyridoxamine 5'-phosphate oxidase family protein n=1 Tax=Undibacterium sp. TaxID=1914977 RepID=UPI002D199FC0|nr:pyridoxamine 5'-phosphate oxidase family protein [Undibacterium sp.]HTD06790.1 pyridoxamine 5'-phosphate oxidase family protein [Undibacterium sp.]
MNAPTENAFEDSPFHAGELRAQQLAGGGSNGAAIRDHMPEQHRSFFGLLPYLLAATTDADGWPSATMLAGPAGFVGSPDARSLQIAVTRADLAPYGAEFAIGKQIGLLGLDLATRRRNRANGFIAAADGQGLLVAIQESFGNCPKYIQARDVESVPADRAAELSHFTALDQQAQDLIRQSDTLFVATTAGEGEGADISHRGGRPGFVRIDGDTLTIPDFVGNRYFNTLGNMLMDPRAALLFVDFANGDLLHVQGTVEVVWDAPEAARFDGAQRLWRLHIQRGWRKRHAVPLRWTLRDYAPTTMLTGSW